ncbi:adenylate/guanylate cyclase domain-containing protein [Amphritea opalescens]|uniref:Adenylate/guanylate cyclase domain-containing protein n=1 Tax=Amphritea opalescens TaxID=2490544 RepID=A0A430KMS9_9GAMM|nr:adenylate/guanylate cyclase domain-containing protein [Amphritea opalescens]RTE64756.1 adenylate/guanylate cyclase domain-containing protein [Amphritea opalescens]
MKQRRIRTLLGIMLTLLMLYPVIQDSRPALLQKFEYDLYDLRLRHFAKGDQDPRIVIVDVDEKSLLEQGRWPWNRAKLAQLLDQLFDRYDVAIVGFDMVFSEADSSIDLQQLSRLLQDAKTIPSLASLRQQLDPDQRLAEAIDDRPVVLGYAFDRSDRELRVGNPGVSVMGSDVLLDKQPIPEAKGVIASIDTLQRQDVYGGFFDNPMVDSDGVYRWVPMLQRYQGEYYPSLALAMWLALFDEHQVMPEFESDISGEQQTLVAINAAGQQIPVNPSSGLLVPYRGGQGSFPYISATDVINGLADPEQLSGAIILIGTSAAGLLDLRVTPVSSRYPGVEVHANILSGLLDDRISSEPDYTLGVEIIQILLSGLLLSLLIPRSSVMFSTLMTLVWVATLVGFNLYAWQSLLWVIPLGYTLFLIFILYLFQQTTGYFFETRNMKRLAGQFGYYIPPEIVQELGRQQNAVHLSGETREMTIFFSDIRDFTQISEQLSPQQLSRMMNIYLTEMTRIIHQQRGTVDKYIGDAVMAFWGAPLPDEEHAKHGLNTAWQMLLQLPRVNQQLLAAGLPRVNIGIGLHCGTVSVGNMGSEFRMAYTVMGDAVNLASRLESLTKYYGCPLLVSGDLATGSPDYLYRYIDRVRVKGRTEPVELFQPLAERASADASLVAQIEIFNRAVRCYQQGQWEEARRLFLHWLADNAEDSVAPLYLERLNALERDPPKENWDAVFSHQEK